MHDVHETKNNTSKKLIVRQPEGQHWREIVNNVLRQTETWKFKWVETSLTLPPRTLATFSLDVFTTAAPICALSSLLAGPEDVVSAAP